MDAEEAAAEDATAFLPEQVTAIIKESVEYTLANSHYSHAKVPQWTSNVNFTRTHARTHAHTCDTHTHSLNIQPFNTQIIERTMTGLKNLNKPFKYVVTSAIVQKCGSGVHLASSCYWDNTQDCELPHISRPSALVYCANSLIFSHTNLYIIRSERFSSMGNEDNVLFDHSLWVRLVK